jgi:DNA repair protein RecO
MKITGIVINSNQYKESASIVNLLTSEGLFPLLAKGIRKGEAKNRALILELSISSIEYVSSHNKNILTGGEVISSSSYLLDSFYGVMFINFVKETFYKILLDREAKELYIPLLNSLKNIENDPKNDYLILLMMNYLLLISLTIAGYNPITYAKTDVNYSKYFNLLNNISDGAISTKYSKIELIDALKFMNQLLFNYNNIKINTIDLLI